MVEQCINVGCKVIVVGLRRSLVDHG